MNQALTDIDLLVVVDLAFRRFVLGLLLGFPAADRCLHEVPDPQQAGLPVLLGGGGSRGGGGGGGGVLRGPRGEVPPLPGRAVVASAGRGGLVVGVVVEGQHLDELAHLFQLVLELYEALHLSSERAEESGTWRVDGGIEAH